MKEQRWALTFAWIVFGLYVIFLGGRFYYRLTDDVHPGNMMQNLSYRREWEIPPLNESEVKQLNNILDQPFTYLGKGAQSYAFISADKKYILKFYKTKHLQPNKWLQALPSIGPIKNYQLAHKEKRERNLSQIFSGYTLAYRLNRHESGLIYIHLNGENDLDLHDKPFKPFKPSESEALTHQVTIIDKLGKSQIINLDRYAYIIQEAVIMNRDLLHQVLLKKDVNAAKQQIDRIFDLYLQEYRKGIYDKDHGVLHNTGFIEDRAVHFDVGKLTYDPSISEPEKLRDDLIEVAKKYEFWIRIHHPEVYDELVPYIENKLSEITYQSYSFSGK